MQYNFCFPGITGPTYKHPENIAWHARVALFVATLRQIWVVIWDLHSFFSSPIYDVEIMSKQKWHQLAGEFGQLSGEEILKPVPRRLDKESTSQQTR